MRNTDLRREAEAGLVNQSLYFIFGLYGLWLVLAIVFAFVGQGAILADAGQFGDWFGSLNALFSGGALFFIGLTLWRSRGEAMDQERRHERQQFADHFFQLLNSFQNVVNQTASGQISGRRSFSNLKQGLYNTQREMMSRVWAESRANKVPASRDIIDDWYGEFYRGDGRLIGHYFRLLYHVVLFVDGQDEQVLSSDEKYRYVRLVRAHLSQDELELLFFNALHGQDNKMHALIEKYDLLQNMMLGNVISDNELTFFPQSAARRAESSTL